MGLFSNLMNSIWRHAPEKTPAPASAPVTAPVATIAPTAAISPAQAAPAAATAELHAATATAATTPVHVIDVEAILDGLRAQRPNDDLDWRRSIVDLMSLVGMDHSLASRRELAKELGYTGSTTDTATMNVWLHKQVLTQITMNGGKVPANLLD
ncbi:MAG: DUF3597 domain-containing protein [Candidatus Methylacidiphilales bacterium]|nr:DUF3597 domain-containing protein [Candidatus Methylacidiphilales bacterium]